MPPPPEGKQTTPEIDLEEIFVEGLEVFEMPGPDAEEPTAAKPAPSIKKDKEPTKDELSEEEKKAKDELRFKTHKEAEEGYREKQARVTKVEQENADLRKAAGTHEAEMKKVKEKEEAEKAEEKQAEVDKKVLDYSRKRHDEILQKIEDLDPEDPEHRSKVADLWSTVGADVRKFEKDAADAPLEEPEAKPGETVKEKPGEKKESVKAKATEETTPDDSEFKTDAEARSYVEDKVKAAGRDFNNPVMQRAAIFSPQSNDAGAELTLDDQIEWAMKSADKYMEAVKTEGIDPEDPVYLHMVYKAPVENSEGEKLSLDDQMKNALEETKKFKAAEKARIIQEASLPLSAGGPAKPGPGEKGAPEKGMSLGSAIDEATESRRL